MSAVRAILGGMSAKGKRQPKRTATRKPERPKLRVAIATSPSRNRGGVSLAGDLELVRAAMLYADEVRLISPASELVLSAAAMGDGNGDQILRLLLSLPDKTVQQLNGNRPMPPNWREAMLAVDFLGPAAGDAYSRLRDGLATSLQQWREIAGRMLDTSGGREMQAALRSGVVTLGSLARLDQLESADAIDAFVAELKALLNNSRWHLLLDGQTAGLVRALVRESIVTPGEFVAANAARAAVGSGVIARLPAFPQVPVDEILTLRREVADPLHRYRLATLDLSTKLRSGPFDDELGRDIDELYAAVVSPSLGELRAALADHGLVREVARSLRLDLLSLVGGGVGSVMGVGLAESSQVNGWMQALAGGLPLALSVASSGVHGVAQRNQASEAARRHELFYLLEVERRAAS